MSRSRTLLLPTVVVLLTACGPSTRWDHTPREYHVVRSGETLYSIAWRYGKDQQDLARWNNLGDGSLIYVGQTLRLTGPAARPARSAAARASPPPRRSAPAPADPPPSWRWPTAGTVVTSFGERPGTGTGILIRGRAGQPVVAAAAGRVVYAGGGLIGYGKLIIVKHNDTYLSAYGYNASLPVDEGDAIRKGQRIATMGEGPGQEPRLHFEIRKNGEPVNPRQHLPAR